MTPDEARQFYEEDEDPAKIRALYDAHDSECDSSLDAVLICPACAAIESRRQDQIVRKEGL